MVSVRSLILKKYLLDSQQENLICFTFEPWIVGDIKGNFSYRSISFEIFFPSQLFLQMKDLDISGGREVKYTPSPKKASRPLVDFLIILVSRMEIAASRLV